MNIGQFLIIFWARRLLIFWATVSCLVGALIVCAILPPRWESTARVMLDYIKPDPVTGEIISGGAAGAYVNTQIQLVTDYTVSGRVAEQIGWFTDPNLINAYANRARGDQRDFRHFLADMVSQNTKAKSLAMSNILEMTYTASTAKGAEAAANALAKAYMDAVLQERREDAEHNAVWYDEQAVKAKADLDKAVTTMTAYEKENGIVLQNDKMDADSERLQSLSMQPGTLQTPFVPTQDSSPTATQLAQTDAELNVAQKTLGPNNPAMLELRARRTALADAVAKESANTRAYAAHAAASGTEALQRELAAQKSRVIAQGDKIGRLSQLEQDVDLRRQWYQHTTAKAAEFREQAVSSDTGVTPLGTASTPKEPVFPNYWLIVPGAIVLGLGVGVMVSLLMELLGRRVRSVSDLDLVDVAPLICVIPGTQRANPSRFPAILTPWRRRRRFAPNAAARA
jgi:polysaccharide biosynthesis transport protein